MIVKEIRLRNYRNFDKFHIVFNPKMNVITGQNGQGKTNLLESLIFLSTTHSHRIQDDQKLIQTGKELANIDCLYFDEIEYRIGSVIYQKGKSLLLNKQPVSKSSDFIGLLNVILFSPSDINIFEQSPRERRKLINLEITKVNKRYLNSLNNYQKLLKERNLSFKREKIDMVYLNVIEDKMIENQLVILNERYKFVSIINSKINDYLKKLMDTDVNIFVEYVGCVKDDEDEIKKENLKNMYKQNFDKDRFNQMTNMGIHRDDLMFWINGENVNDVASQGQRRLVIMALKLSLINYIKEKTGKTPILLLDDVLSELDIDKQRNLLNCIDENIQTIITTSVLSESLSSLNKNLNIQTINAGKLI